MADNKVKRLIEFRKRSYSLLQMQASLEGIDMVAVIEKAIENYANPTVKEIINSEYGEWEDRARSKKKPGKPKGTKPKEEAPKEEVAKETKPKEEAPKEEVAKETKPKEEAPKEEVAKETKSKEEAPKEEVAKETKSKEEAPSEVDNEIAVTMIEDDGLTDEERELLECYG